MCSLNMTNLLAVNLEEFRSILSCYLKKANELKTINIANENAFINAILSDTFLCNLFVGFVGYNMLISNNPQWENIDTQLEDHTNNYFNDSVFAKKIRDFIDANKKNLSNEHQIFFNVLMRKFNMTQKTSQINSNISIIEHRINDNINTYPLLRIAKKYIQQKSNLKIESEVDNMYLIRLSHSNFQILYDTIQDIQICHSIESKYNSTTNGTLNDIAQLVLLRNKMANMCGFNSYYNMISCDKNDNTKTIINLITTINSKIDSKCNVEISNIYDYFSKHNKNETKIKITHSDVKKYASQHRSSIKFHPNHVLSVIFNVIKLYFGIIFTNHSKIKNIDVYEAVHKTDSTTSDGKVLGKLYIDLYKSDNKSINMPIAIKITDKFKLSNKKPTVSEIILVGNYCNDTCLTFYDVLSIFKEFGHVIRNLAYSSTLGLINYDEEFAFFMPMVMEHMCYDKDTIKLLLNSNDVNAIESIYSEKYIDMCFSLKLKCIDAEFDYFLHNDSNFIKLLEIASNKNEDIGAAILKLYSEIMAKNLAMIGDKFDMTTKYIPPRVIIQLINQSQGLLYSNIINDIFGYTTFCLIKRNANNRFCETVLANVTSTYRELIQDFIKKSNANWIDSYILHVTDGILNSRTNNLLFTEDTNCFDDGSDSESDADRESIH